jgi:hypothetical protein
MKALCMALLLVGINVGSALAAAPSPSDSRKIFGIDPRPTFASNPKWRYQLQVSNSSPDLTTVGEPGWWDPKVSQHIVLRTTDPANGSKKAFRHRIKQGMTYRGSTARAEGVCTWGSPSCIQVGVPYWAVFAFYVDKDHPFNGTGGGIGLLELGHPVTSQNAYASPGFALRENGTWDAQVNYNKVLNGGPATRVSSKLFSQTIQKGVWHYVIVQFKLHWDSSKSPYIRVWKATGGGSPVQIANRNAPNTYNESVSYKPQKFGLYLWDITSKGWGSSTTRTIYTKGLHVFKDVSGTPALSVSSLLEYVRAI